jgi:hypothetical protein
MRGLSGPLPGREGHCLPYGPASELEPDCTADAALATSGQRRGSPGGVISRQRGVITSQNHRPPGHKKAHSALLATPLSKPRAHTLPIHYIYIDQLPTEEMQRRCRRRASIDGHFTCEESEKGIFLQSPNTTRRTG